MSFVVRSNFIDVFKIGDNINYNLQVLKELYQAYDLVSDGSLLIKPIVLINTAIVEALLYDFIENRIRKANRSEPLFQSIFKNILSKKLDTFEHYIAQAEKYNFFSSNNSKLYLDMQDLRKKRNRIHIQNVKGMLPRDEVFAFDDYSKKLSERVLEETVKKLSIMYPRREEYQGYVEDFEFPWVPHFPKV